MARASIPVDLFNPGHVFACIGFVEAADQIFGMAQGSFDWTANAEPRFHMSAETVANPFEAVLATLALAKVTALAPQGAGLSTEKWDVPTTVLTAEDSFPIRPPRTPATLPARLECQVEGKAVSIDLDHWGDSTLRDNVKFWAGAGGYPGVGLLRDALDLVRDELGNVGEDPFAVAKPQSSSFRFDWRRDYIPLDAGFSPNDHGNVTMMGYPIVEILAAIGLTNARPRRSESTKLEYRYSVLGILDDGSLYDPTLLRAALGGAELPFPRRDFRMLLGWPGQENQARCITNVIEETRGPISC